MNKVTEAVAREVLAWWEACREAGRAAVLFCYALGKAQRLLAELSRLTDREVLVHVATHALTEVYREAGGMAGGGFCSAHGPAVPRGLGIAFGAFGLAGIALGLRRAQRPVRGNTKGDAR